MKALVTGGGGFLGKAATVSATEQPPGVALRAAATGEEIRYPHGMVENVEVPEEIAAEARRTAAELGLSPAEFYAKAIERAVVRERRRRSVTDQINTVYDKLTAGERHEELRSLEAGLTHLEKEDW